MRHLLLTSPPAPCVALAWNGCLDNSEFATHYAAPEFFDEPYFKSRDPFAVLALEGDTVCGVVTGLRNGRTLNCGQPGVPHVCIRSGVDGGTVGGALAEGLRDNRGKSTHFISLFSWVALPGLRTAGFRERHYGEPLCSVVLDLSKGKDVLFRQCSETRRNKIRRAIKAGVEVREMDAAVDFDDYYQLYVHWCGFKGLTVQPYEAQRAAVELKKNRLTLVARHEGKLIGVSTFRYRRPGVVEYAANVSRREETGVRQNDLLLWRGVEWAVEQGCFRLFSMAGSHFFLQKFGGELRQSYGYSEDRTLLRTYHARYGLNSVASRLYKALPESTRRVVKKVLRRGGASE